MKAKKTAKKRAPKKTVAAKKKPVKKVPRRPAQKAGKKKAAAKKSAKPGIPPGMEGREVGRVVAFFRIPVVAVVKVTKGSLKAGDQIWIKGHTTDQKLTVSSMQINHQPIPEAKKGDEAGVKVSSRARRGDRVYRIAP